MKQSVTRVRSTGLNFRWADQFFFPVCSFKVIDRVLKSVFGLGVIFEVKDIRANCFCASYTHANSHATSCIDARAKQDDKADDPC